MELRGARELEAALKGLGNDRLIRDTLSRALVNAGQPAVSTARALVRKDTHRTEVGIGISTTLSRRQKRGGYKNTKNKVHVFLGAKPKGPAVLIEFGTGPRYHKSGKFVGVMPAFPFMRPAWEEHKHQILDDFSAELWTQIEKSAARLAKRSLKAAGR